MTPEVSELNPDLLAGRRVIVAGAGPDLNGLGSGIARIEDPASLDDESASAAAAGLSGRDGGLDAVVVDAGSAFGAGGGEGMAVALDTAWRMARAAATAGMIGHGGGTVVLLAPHRAEGDLAATAVADGLENAARGLSVEWARFDIRVVAVCPREGAAATDVRSLVAWLCSATGTYASGCRFDPGP